MNELTEMEISLGVANCRLFLPILANLSISISLSIRNRAAIRSGFNLIAFIRFGIKQRRIRNSNERKVNREFTVIE